MNIQLTQWNKFGDHALVQEITNKEFEYEEAKSEGAGAINHWFLVYPGQYIVEINNEFISVITEEKAQRILAFQS